MTIEPLDEYSKYSWGSQSGMSSPLRGTTERRMSGKEPQNDHQSRNKSVSEKYLRQGRCDAGAALNWSRLRWERAMHAKLRKNWP